MYHQICELEAHHGVCLGTSYVNETVGKEMYTTLMSPEDKS